MPTTQLDRGATQRPQAHATLRPIATTLRRALTLVSTGAVITASLVASPQAHAASLLLPWAAGAWNVTQGLHSGAWDFQPPGAGSHNNEVLAVAGGVAKMTCTDSAGQTIVSLATASGTFKYLHLQTSAVQAAGITAGGTNVIQGQVIGRLHPSPPGADPGCGYAIPAGASHLHLVMPTIPITIDSVAFSASGPNGVTPLTSTNVRNTGTPPPDPDGDGDGVPDDDDLCPESPGASNTHGCPLEDFDSSTLSDFNGDGFTDIATFYDYGGGHTRGFVFNGSATGLASKYSQFWDSGAGAFEAGRARWVAGFAYRPLLPTATTPEISGTANVGGTLAARPGEWQPASVARAYQWLRDGSAIAGATKSSYTVTVADLDATLSVRVTGSKAGYATLSRTSKATATVAAGSLFAATPKITGIKKVGKTLTTNPGTWGPSPVTLSYQWYRSGTKINGATKATYTLTGADYSATLTVKVTGTKTGYTAFTKISPATAKPRSTDGHGSVCVISVGRV